MSSPALSSAGPGAVARVDSLRRCAVYHVVDAHANMLRGCELTDEKDGTSVYRGDGKPGLHGAGVGVGYTCGLGLSPRAPVHLEVGASLGCASHKDTLLLVDWQNLRYIPLKRCFFQYLALGVQANMAYKFPLRPGRVWLKPFVGANMRVNLIAERTDFEWEPEDTVGFKQVWQDGSRGLRRNLLCRVGFRRVQFGLNAGLGVTLRRVYIGYRVQPDLTPFIREGCRWTLTMWHQISLGVEFN